MSFAEDELAKIEKLNQQALRFFDQWTSFKQEFSVTAQAQKKGAWHLSMVMIAWRMAENFDSLRILTINHRPPAAYMVYRSVYEAWLNLLLLGFHQGEIDSNLLVRDKGRKDKKRWLAPTKEQLARRFIAFGWHAELEHLENLRSNTKEFEEMCHKSGKSLAEAAQATRFWDLHGSRARSVYGFGDRKNTWSPFLGMWQQREHLWPDRGAGTPIFPSGLVPLDGELWREAYYHGYRVAGHFVHGSSATHGSILGRDPSLRTHKVHDTPYPDSFPLETGIHTAYLASAAFADAMGEMRLWNKFMGSLDSGTTLNVRLMSQP